MKRILSGVLAIVLVLSLMPVTPSTAQTATSGDYTYTVSNGEATITGYTGAGSNITIPSVLGGYPVTSIGRYAFTGCNSLTSITIPNSVTSIGDSAFAGCRRLTSITIPDSVTSIWGTAFNACENLETIKVAKNNTRYHSDGNCLIETATKTLIAGCINSQIPDDGSVTSIGDFAFCDCFSLARITIPDSVTSIGAYAFAGCSSLTSITIPNSVTSIGACAFLYCASLTSITIPNSVTGIRDGSFRGCRRLTRITIPGSVTWIGNYAFQDCSSLTRITIPDSVTSIGGSAFKGCSSLKSIYYLGYWRDWQKLSVGSGNEPLIDAQWNYAVCPGHTYDDACDATCNVCKEVRSEIHVYDNACDKECNNCRFVRVVGDHQYIVNGGLTCSICKYSKAPPAPELLSVTANSLTLVSVGGLEYSADGINWQDSPTFNDLVNNTQQRFYQRVKGSDNAIVSQPSAALTVNFRVCTVSYDANGGHNAPDKQFALYSNRLVLSSEKPIREGFFFAGWKTKGNGDMQYAPGEEFVADYDVTLYALWNEQCATCAGTGKTEGSEPCYCDNGYIEETTSRCSSCRWTDCITKHQMGSYSYTECRKCGAIGTGSFSTSTSKHSACNGKGVIVIAETCPTCDGSGIKSYTHGDVTDDGKINSLDGLMLLRYLNGWNVTINSPEAMDVNADGKVNSLDGLILMRYLNGWNVTLG